MRKHTSSSAEILAIGSELLLGGRLDTNSLFLTEALAALGIEVRHKTVVGDDRHDIAAAIRVASRRAGLLVMTGGLGPTGDDCTREAVAQVSRRPLQRNADAARQLTAWLRSRNRVPTDAQLQQALLPRGAQILRNPVGSAPGFLIRWNRLTIVALPGVPVEAQEMFHQAAAPILDTRRRSRTQIVRRVLLTYGLPESELEASIQDLVSQDSGIRLGTLASPFGVTLSLTWAGAFPQSRRGAAPGRSTDPQQLVEGVATSLRARLGTLVFGEGTDTMEEIVGRALSARGWTIATAESCTGGLIGHRLTQVPGSSAYFDGGTVCYSNDSKTRWLGVAPALIERHGAVSAEVALAMAEGIRERSHCSIGLSVTGIAGPGGATAHKPVGLVYVGLVSPNRAAAVKEFRFHGPRDGIKLRASQAALNWVRLSLIDA